MIEDFSSFHAKYEPQSTAIGEYYEAIINKRGEIRG